MNWQRLHGTCVRTRAHMRAPIFLHVSVSVMQSVVSTYRDDVLLLQLAILGVAVDTLERIPVNLYITNIGNTLCLTNAMYI